MNYIEAVKYYNDKGLAGDQAFQIDDIPGSVGLRIVDGKAEVIMRPSPDWKIAQSQGVPPIIGNSLEVTKTGVTSTIRYRQRPVKK